MDFIERISNFAPDGGNGVWEICIVLAIAVALSAMALRPRREPRAR